jgi:hypothetical protein
VVDNGSADDPATEVQHSFPGARTIRNSTNIGSRRVHGRGAVGRGDLRLLRRCRAWLAAEPLGSRCLVCAAGIAQAQVVRRTSSNMGKCL